MGPTALFDKSFLQQLSEDESVWFDHFFQACVSPMFYVETLADLAKNPRPGRSQDHEVAIISQKFPEMHGTPCVFHHELAFQNLMGQPIPMTGQIPVRGGRPVKNAGRTGVVFDSLNENEAFARWGDGHFDDVERRFAHYWRQTISSLDLRSGIDLLRPMGLVGLRCKTLEEARDVARQFVSETSKPFERMRVASHILSIESRYHQTLVRRWQIAGCPPLATYAPYAAHVVAVEIFFLLAMDNGLISADRPSNRNDIAYLHYLPFCMLMVSTDRLHRRCAPLFMREDQRFAWGHDLKAGLTDLDEYYALLPEAERKKGIMAVAPYPPGDHETLISKLWDEFAPRWRSLASTYQGPPSNPRSAATVRAMQEFVEAPTAAAEDVDFNPSNPDSISIQRHVSQRKGKWWQLPHDIEPIKR